MSEPEIIRITKFPDNVIPLPDLMKQYVFTFRKDVGMKRQLHFPYNEVSMEEFLMAKEYYQRLYG